MNASDTSIFLGVDIGTTGAKCTFYDLSGRPLGGAYREYPMLHPRPGWVEEDPAAWWEAVADNLQSCFRRRSVDPAQVAGVGVSCTNAFFPVDKQGEPLHHAILQLDQRTREEVEWIDARIGAERIFRATGNRIAPGTFALPTLRWFLRHRPDIVHSAHKFLMPSGFIVCKLTGEFSINLSRMGFTLLGDIRAGAWDESLARDARVPPEKLPRPYRAHDIVGTVSKSAAKRTGLIEGTPVVAGAMDTVAAAVGAGALKPGDAFLALGTCGRLCYATDRDEFDDRLMNCRHAVDGQWLAIEATNGTGVSLRWFRDVFGEALANRAQNEKKSVYALIDELAADSPPGAGGALYLPYLAGERCPIWDPDARGVIFGLHLATTYGDMARAVMEGVAFSIRQGMEIVLKDGRAAPYLSLGGGVAKSAVWSRILADVLEYPILRLNVNETETLGGAILAAYGTGHLRRMEDMASFASRGAEILLPDKKNARLYRSYFDLYKKLYLDLKDDFQALKSIARRSEAD